MRRSEADFGTPMAVAEQGRPGAVDLVGRLPLLPEGQARAHIKRALDGLGCPYETVPFSATLRLPVAWQVRARGVASGSAWVAVPSAAAVGSPTCRDVEGPVTSVGAGAPTEYRLGGELCRGGIVLAALRTVPARQIIHVARDHGARGVLLYHPHASSVQAVAPDTHLPLPAATIGRGAAMALAREGGAARLDVESEETNLSLENMFVRRGEGPLHVVAVAHYDSRPRRLGPAARSLGLAAMLSLLDTVKPPADRRITFALLDGEEFGSVGRARYYEDVRREAVEPPDLVVDLNALGTRRDLGLEVHSPRGESRGLQDFALRTFEAAGLHLVPRELDRGFYGGTPGLRAGCPVLALGGRPRPRVPCGDPEHGIPDRWGVSHLVGPITALLYGARP